MAKLNVKSGACGALLNVPWLVVAVHFVAETRQKVFCTSRRQRLAVFVAVSATT